MIVQKFGGTSMGTPASIRQNVSQIVRTAVQEGKAPVVVVSAMTGVTNRLLEAAQSAVGEGVVRHDIIDALRDRHLEVLKGLESEGRRVVETEDAFRKELEDLAGFLKAVGVIRELSQRSHDAIIAMGEKWSARIMACVLECQGVPAEYVNLESVIPESLPYESDVYWDEVEVLLKERICRVEPGIVPVLTGFFGQTARGMLASVGRGYSDYCASLAGAALKVEEIQIWTDVDGVLSANPKVVPQAFILDRMSFDEMAELAHFGAKVLHPFSVRPAVNAGIPIRIMNTFNPACRGTLVEEESVQLKLPFKSITSKSGVSIIRITTPVMLLAHGYMAKVSRVFARHKISIDLIATSEVSVSMSVEEKMDKASSFITELSQHGDVKVQSGQSIVSLVGAEMQTDGSVLGRVFEVLNRNRIPVNMASLGNALINLSLVINDTDCDRAVKVLHEEFF